MVRATARERVPTGEERAGGGPAGVRAGRTFSEANFPRPIFFICSRRAFLACVTRGGTGNGVSVGGTSTTVILGQIEHQRPAGKSGIHPGEG